MQIIQLNQSHLPVDIEKYNNIFSQLSDQMIIEIFEPNEVIIHFNKPIRYLRFLVEGRAKVSLVHENGNPSIVHFVQPDEYLGELTFLELEKEHKHVTAISKCLFLSIEMQLAYKWLKDDAVFLYQLAQFVGRKMLIRTHFNAKNQNYELKNRLAEYILLTAHNGVYKEKHTETAAYLNVSYRHLLYTFQLFTEAGYITKDKKGYTINEAALKVLAKDIRLI